MSVPKKSKTSAFRFSLTVAVVLAVATGIEDEVASLAGILTAKQYIGIGNGNAVSRRLEHQLRISTFRKYRMGSCHGLIEPKPSLATPDSHTSCSSQKCRENVRHKTNCLRNA